MSQNKIVLTTCLQKEKATFRSRTPRVELDCLPISQLVQSCPAAVGIKSLQWPHILVFTEASPKVELSAVESLLTELSL